MAEAGLKITVSVDTSPFDGAVASLAGALDALPENGRASIGNRALDLIKGDLAFDFHTPVTGGASEALVIMQPSKAFLDLVAAAGAGNFDGGAS